MIRKATINVIGRIIELLHQVDMVHHELRPDLLADENKPVFVYEDGGGFIIDKYD